MREQPDLERVEVDTSGLLDGELVPLADFLELAAAANLEQPDAARLLLLDVAEQLRSIGNGREVRMWQLEQVLFDPPDPNEPIRRWWPPGWRRPDDEAVGL
jgi:hypothetical protein